MYGEFCSQKVAIFLILFLHFRSLCEAKIDVLHRKTKEIVYTVQENPISDPIHNVRNNNKTYIVSVEPSDACENLRAPPPTDLVDIRTSNSGGSESNSEVKWILLAQSNGCDLEEIKIKALKLGYSYLFLYGDANKGIYPKSSHGIPTFVFSHSDGTVLKEEYSYPKRYFVRITEGIPWYNSLIDLYNLAKTFSVATLTHWTVQCCVFGLLLTIFFCRLLGYRFGFSVELRGIRMDVTLYSQSDSDNDEHLRFSPEDITWLSQLMNERFGVRLSQGRGPPVSTIEWQPQEGKDDLCPICLDQYTPNEGLSSLPCNHYYHKGCIETWLSSGRQMCPLCRHPVIPENERMLEQLVRDYNIANSEINSSDWIQERHDRLRDTWYNINW